MVLLLTSTTYAQVGINTEEPTSTLDVVKSADETLADGIQSPRLTYSELVAKNNLYDANQTSALVYVTEGPASGVVPTGKVAKVLKEGYYYFDGEIWEPIVDTSIYKANGTIRGENRIVYMNSANGQNGKMFFTSRNNGATLSGALQNTGTIFNLIGKSTPTMAEMENFGIFMLSSGVSNYMNQAHLFGPSNYLINSKVQFLSYLANYPDYPINSVYLGGSPVSSVARTSNNVFITVRNKQRENYGAVALNNTAVPIEIKGFGTMVSGTTGLSTDEWRPHTTIRNTNLYLNNLEHGTTENPAPAETAGQVLTLITDPDHSDKLKAVWRNSANTTVNPVLVKFTANYNLENTNTATYFMFEGTANANFTLPVPSAQQITSLKQITLINMTDKDINFDGANGPRRTTEKIAKISSGTRLTLMAVPTATGGEWIVMEGYNGLISF